MRFEFATATRIVFGPGTHAEIGQLAAAMIPSVSVRRALVVTGHDPRRAGPVIAGLEAIGFACATFGVEGEPTTDTARRGTALARKHDAGIVVGIGGGSALDTGKAVAALLTNPGDPLDYLEVIGAGKPIARRAAPYIAVPTTAGTGAEVTRNAVLASPEHRVKVSLRSPLVLPALALVDPELTADLPPAVTASTGLDALTQLIEPFVSARANPLTDALCREGIARVARSLRTAHRGGSCPEAREDMALASLFGGLALANAGLGAVHGFAGPIGGMFPVPHGAVCAALLPHVMRANLAALRARGPESPVLARYDEIARIVTGTHDADADEGARWAAGLVADLAIPSLASYGLQPADLPTLVEKAAAASSMRGNPIPLSPAEMHAILERAL